MKIFQRSTSNFGKSNEQIHFISSIFLSTFIIFDHGSYWTMNEIIYSVNSWKRSVNYYKILLYFRMSNFLIILISYVYSSENFCNHTMSTYIRRDYHFDKIYFCSMNIANVNFVKMVVSPYIRWHCVITKIFAAVNIRNQYYKINFLLTLIQEILKNLMKYNNLFQYYLHH